MPYRLLFVDDEDALRTLMRDQLSLEGFEVETAENGEDAVALLQKDEFDLVLLDIRMPGMDGIAVLNFMKTQRIMPRVIMLTALDDLAMADQSVKLGASDYMTKPYALADLLSCIHRVLAQ